MAKAELSNKVETKVEDTSTLKGTLTSVFLIGAVIIAFWVGVYFLYLDRF